MCDRKLKTGNYGREPLRFLQSRRLRYATPFQATMENVPKEARNQNGISLNMILLLRTQQELWG